MQYVCHKPVIFWHVLGDRGGGGRLGGACFLIILRVLWMIVRGVKEMPCLYVCAVGCIVSAMPC